MVKVTSRAKQSEDSTENNEPYEEYANKAVLPQWLTNEFPKHDKLAHISFNGKEFIVAEEPELKFNSLAEASDYVENKLGYAAQFDDSVDGAGGNLVGGIFFCKEDSTSPFGRMLLAHSSYDTERLLKYTYRTWLEKTDPEYQANPNNWVIAYNWLREHPAFWYRDKDEKTFRWRTDNGLHSMWSAVGTEDGKNFVMLEHGAHVEDSYTHHYHDHRLDVVGRTFSNAYVKLAKKVNKFFAPDGTERPNVRHRRSRNQIELEARLADANADIDRYKEAQRSD